MPTRGLSSDKAVSGNVPALRTQSRLTLHNSPLTERSLDALIRLRHLAEEEKDGQDLRLGLLCALVSVARDIENGSRQRVLKALADQDPTKVCARRRALKLQDAADATERGNDEFLVAIICQWRHSGQHSSQKKRLRDAQSSSRSSTRTRRPRQLMNI